MIGVVQLGSEADAAPAGSGGDDLLHPRECACADEQDVLRVQLEVFLLRMLPASLGRDGGDGPLDNLQEGLLNAFAGDVPGDRWILRLA